VIKGGYRFGAYGEGKPQVTLMGSGAILTEVIKAAEILAKEGVASEVVSVTSWSELSREALDSHPRGNDEAYVRRLIERTTGPIVAATDYVRAVPESIRAFVPEGRHYKTLGTDGFGRSDTRAALREFFGVDAASIAECATRAVSR
jgi:pyruvate dehydrogenase E1 component